MRQWTAILENKFRDESFISAQVRFRANSEHDAWRIMQQMLKDIGQNDIIRIAGIVEMKTSLLHLVE